MQTLTKSIDSPQARGESNTIELYLVVLYAGLDWLFRQGGLSFMQGIWDELLFIGIIGLWILRMALNQWRPRHSGMLLPFALYWQSWFFYLWLILLITE